MYVYAQAVVVYLTGGHVPGYRWVATSGGAIGSQGTWDHVLGLACDAVVPATDGGVSSSPPTRDGVLGRSGVGYVL